MDIHQKNYTNRSLLSTLTSSPDSSLEAFLHSTSEHELVLSWIKLAPPSPTIKTKKQYIRFLAAQIAQLDQQINEQLNAILHHSEFQNLEARWQGLKLLVEEKEAEDTIKIFLLTITYEEIYKDLSKLEFDQSELFDKIYNQRFGSPGEYPFNLLLGDYYFNVAGNNSRKDLEILTGISHIAAASFCPFITSISPSSFGVTNFCELGVIKNIEKLFDAPEYNNWINFRKNTDSRFIGITLPRILLRQNYQNKTLQKHSFYFDEEIRTLDNKNYLWGNACFAFGLVVIRSFKLSGWFGEIRGIKDPKVGGGIVSQLPNISIVSNDVVNFTGTVETNIDENDESLLSDLGFIPLCSYGKNKQAIFYSNMSSYKPNYSYGPNSKISSMLQYILCASRFAHYVKIIGRDKIGLLTTTEECAKSLNAWIQDYIATNEAGESIRRRYPLQGAKVEIKEIPGKPGCYNCVMHLQPRYQLEKVNTALTLITELTQIST